MCKLLLKKFAASFIMSALSHGNARNSDCAFPTSRELAGELSCRSNSFPAVKAANDIRPPSGSTSFTTTRRREYIFQAVTDEQTHSPASSASAFISNLYQLNPPRHSFEHALASEHSVALVGRSMQKMTGGDGDTHDHGPPDKPTTSTTPTTAAGKAGQIITQNTPFPRLAIWSTKMSSAGVNSFSGAMAGVASGIVTCPLDVIKTRLQAGRSVYRELGLPLPDLHRGIRSTAAEILKNDGVIGFYRGLGPMLLGYLPTWAVYMSVYDSSREYFYHRGYGDKDRDKWFARVYASVTAGACSTLVTNPIWVIKTRMMAQVSTGPASRRDPKQSARQYNNTLDAVRKMYRSEGMRVFYAGLAPAMMGLSHVAIQFPLYEYFKLRFTGLEMGETPTEKGNEVGNTVGILAATFLSKVCATTATYPHEVVRTRLQTQTRHLHPERSSGMMGAHHHTQSLPTNGKLVGNTDGAAYRPQYKGVISTCKVILQEEGWRAFYSGLGTNLVRAVPAAMTTMLTFESIKGGFGRLQEKGRELEKEGL